MLNIISSLSEHFSKKKSTNLLKGHLFVASHSVFLVPLFEYEEQIFMENNSIVKKSSNLNSKLFDNLIGFKNRNLFDFLDSVYAWDYASYVGECLKRPSSIENIDENDEQLVALYNAISPKIKDKDEITLLDYGCGKIARVGQYLTQRSVSRIKYYAYDEYEEIDASSINKDDMPCLNKIIKCPTEFANENSKFDIILLFNVLHEMDILEWEDKLNLLLDKLKDDGFILFSERKILSKGENPYGKSGYLVLSAEELKELFIPSSVENVYNGEKVIHAIIKKNNNKINKQCVSNALKKLIENTKDMIDSVLSNTNNTEEISARKYAFYCQHYFNAEHALKLLSNDNVAAIPPDIMEWTDAKIDKLIDCPKLKKRCFEERAKENDAIGKRCREILEEYSGDKNNNEL